MIRMSLRLPDSIYRQLKVLAERDGMSMNHMAAIAIAEKTTALLTLDYLEERAKRTERGKFEAALAAVPDVEAEEMGRLPERR